MSLYCEIKKPSFAKASEGAVELPGVEPGSRESTKGLSTCVVDCLFVWTKGACRLATLIHSLEDFAHQVRQPSTLVSSR